MNTKTFKLTSPYSATGDQPEAIEKITQNLMHGTREQVLLGVTGSGKTFTMASVIAKLNRPTLIISHNKTLAAQLYQEFRDFFPKNAVSYFVSYYDYYQPESYIPQSDTYIEKETEINEDIDKLRLAATTNLLTRPDTIIVASVSCIYNIGSPREYGHFVLELSTGMNIQRESIFKRLVDLQYVRNDIDFRRGTYRVRGETIDLFPAYEDFCLRLIVDGGKLQEICTINPLTGKVLDKISATVIYPSKHYMTNPATYKTVFEKIHADADSQVALFRKQGKLIEAQRIGERVNYDLEMLSELGYVNGIENYSRYFDGRNPGDPPYTLFDYYDEAIGGKKFASDWLLFVDESHMTIPQIRGMYNGDRSRKQTLIDFGFRLPSAIDNRPLRFDEFLRKIPQTVYVSATPDEWELDRVQDAHGSDKKTSPFVAEQLIRPTGLVDPKISIRPIKNQIEDLYEEILKRTAKKERILITTLTKRMAEDLSDYLEKRQIKVHYLHSEILTLERSDILAKLRQGIYDVIVGINLLREGLDLPEVSLVAILDADKQGFLRSKVSLIQTMGRAARHISGEAILYADVITPAMHDAIAEVERRRKIQLAYNKKNTITPIGINKPIRSSLVEKSTDDDTQPKHFLDITDKHIEALTPFDKKNMIQSLTKAMKLASNELEFETAAKIRDTIARLTEDTK